LALAPNHRLQRDQLLEMLWPDQDPQPAASSFHQALYEARRILDPSAADPQYYLHLHEATLSLCPVSPLLIDAEAFKTAANRAFRTRDIAGYQAALALYYGDLLPNDLYEDWRRNVRVTLWQDHTRPLHGLANLFENPADDPAAEPGFGLARS
jgi:DNA-binding SARP family transcriptional activator